jgi:hypothetical protein
LFSTKKFVNKNDLGHKILLILYSHYRIGFDDWLIKKFAGLDGSPTGPGFWKSRPRRLAAA